jgi:GNAT superfamily N-acetyltransferase
MNDAPVTMKRDSLESIPQFALPTDYSARWFHPGDDRIWQHIQSVSDKLNDITARLFHEQFGSDIDALRQRQCYLLDVSGTEIGTATAWFDDDYEGARYGRLHWVAIVPEMQGRGLAKPLLTILCNRLKALGHRRAYLNTSSSRIAAIGLYLQFGFTPALSSAEETDVWREILAQVDKRNSLRTSSRLTK